MLRTPPRESEVVSWAYVLLCILIIYATIPFARDIQSFVQSSYGRHTFLRIVITFVVAGATGTVFYLIYLYRSRVWCRLFWLFAITSVWIYAALQLKYSPEESLHFVEYGILGLLLYRALVHRFRDRSVFIIAFLLGVIVGTVDEIIQWIVPERLWSFGDVALDALSVGLMLANIVMALQPPVIVNALPVSSLRRVCRIVLVILLLFTMCLLNTPDLVSWYAERIPGLACLKNNDTVMTEYGFRYVDPEIGTFFSRFTIEEIRHQDTERGVEAAQIIDRYRSDEEYGRFLKEYTSSMDPFVHEVRVHIFRRDRYLQRAYEGQDYEKKQRHDCTVAYREDQILKKYFSRTFSNAHYRLSSQDFNFVIDRLDEDHSYVSGVSDHLITRLSKVQVLLVMISLMVLIFVGERLCDRRLSRPNSRKSSTRSPAC